jgi:hypothetical protein
MAIIIIIRKKEEEEIKPLIFNQQKNVNQGAK